MALALVAVFLPVAALVGVGMSAFVIELTRALVLVGPVGLVATCLIALTGFAVRKGIA